jgi:hypothetical protein
MTLICVFLFTSLGAKVSISKQTMLTAASANGSLTLFRITSSPSSPMSGASQQRMHLRSLALLSSRMRKVNEVQPQDVSSMGGRTCIDQKP